MHQGIWLPDGEKHFQAWMTNNGEIVDGKGTYQIKKLRAALGFCKQFRTAVDVGGHVGLWAMQLVKRFQYVNIFEPVPAFRDCLAKNVPDLRQPISTHESAARNYSLYPCALGSKRDVVCMAVDSADTGGTHVRPFDEGKLQNAWSHRHRPTVDLRTLDEFDFADVDFIKIDCEGYEHHVIEGARDTIARWHPTIIVEQKPHKLGPNFGIKGTPAVDLLESMGYQVRAEISGDYILTA